MPAPRTRLALASGAAPRVHAAASGRFALTVADDAGLPAVGEQTRASWASWRGLHDAMVERLPDEGGYVRLEVVEPATSLQRRRYARVAAAVPVRVHLEGLDPVDAVSVDLSEGGLRLVLPQDLVLTQELAVELPALPTPRPQAARVVRQEGGAVALAFVPPIPAARALRSDVLARQARARQLEA